MTNKNCNIFGDNKMRLSPIENSTSRTCISLIFVFVISFSLITTNVWGSKKSNDHPNILMITTHDIGQHIGCYGVKEVQTPNIDKLAEKGIRFTNFYSTSSVCTPGRASLHTGRYPQSNGLFGLTHGPWWWSLHENEKHTAQLLKEVGYKTILAGFNHIGNPSRLGYDLILSKQRKAEETVAEVTDFLKNEKITDTPFFLKAGFVEVHRRFEYGTDSTNGIFVPDYLANTKMMREDLAQFQAEIKYFDSCVGRILEALENSEVAANTLVIFTSDHGIPYPGAKWTARKAGLEVPYIIYKKGEKAFSGGSVYTDVMSNVDVLPTILDYLGIQKPKNLEGVSFWNYLNNIETSSPRKAAFGQYTPDMKRDNASRAVITDEYQLIYYFSEGRSVKFPVDVNPAEFAAHRERCATGGSRPFVQLYNIQEDPYELNNLSEKEEYYEIVKELTIKLYDWMEEVNDPILQGPVASPYYLKARENLNKLVKQQ